MNQNGASGLNTLREQIKLHNNIVTITVSIKYNIIVAGQ